jgi:hypothetical protein
MRIDRIIWDLDNDPRGNVQHIAQHGLTPDEVDEVLYEAKNEDLAYSISSHEPMVFGWTSTGKHILVVFEIVEHEPFAVWPITAYEVEF